MQVMAPPTTSRRSKEDFVQWKEPAQSRVKYKNVDGVASKSGERQTIQATRGNLTVQSPVHSLSASERNFGLLTETNGDCRRENEADLANFSHRAPQPNQSPSTNKFVPPRPNLPSASRGQPQRSSSSPQQHAREANQSPEGRVLQRQHVQSLDTMHGAASGDLEESPATVASGRTPGKQCSSVR